MTEQELDRQLQKGELSPLLFFYGEESFLLGRAEKKLLDQAIDPAMKDFNLNIYYGADCKGTEILDTAQTLPMFSNRRLVVVRQADKLNVAVQEGLLPYLANPSPETCLLFTAAKPDMRRKFFSELKKQSGTIEFKRLYDDRLVPFIQAELSAKGKRIATAGAELLAFMVGNNLHELVSQIEKVTLYVGEKPQITVEDVRGIVSQCKEFGAFELARYMGEKDLPKAVTTLQQMLNNNLEAVMVIGAIASHFRRLWRIRELLDQKVSQGDICKQLKISQFFIKEQLQQAKKHTVQQLERFHEQLYLADLGVKTGRSSAAVLHHLVYEACQ